MKRNRFPEPQVRDRGEGARHPAEAAARTRARRQAEGAGVDVGGDVGGRAGGAGDEDGGGAGHGDQDQRGQRPLNRGPRHIEAPAEALKPGREAVATVARRRWRKLSHRLLVHASARAVNSPPVVPSPDGSPSAETWATSRDVARSLPWRSLLRRVGSSNPIKHCPAPAARASVRTPGDESWVAGDDLWPADGCRLATRPIEIRRPGTALDTSRRLDKCLRFGRACRPWRGP